MDILNIKATCLKVRARKNLYYRREIVYLKTRDAGKRERKRRNSELSVPALCTYQTGGKL